MAISTETSRPVGRTEIISFGRTPYWLIILFIFFISTIYFFISSESYGRALLFIAEGIQMTVLITLVAYVAALLLGLILALGRLSHNTVTHTLATLYIEVVRGVPLLVIIFYARFVIVPWVGDLFSLPLVRNSFLTGVLPLALGYAAYMAEIYRAGIESIDRGQMEAARSLGMNYFQAMRLIILPQAIRRVIPPMSNESLSMLKDSALLSAIGVTELTYWGKATIGRTADTFLGWNTVAFIYLSLGLLLSLLLKWIERRTSSHKER